MRCLTYNLFVLICPLILYLIIGQVQAHQSTVCVKTSIPPVHLRCRENERIHVQNITYQATSPNCQPFSSSDGCKVVQQTRRAALSTICTGLPPQRCRYLRKQARDTLITKCNGRSSCWETLQDYWMKQTCGETAFTVTVIYECIPDAVIVDLCDSITATPEVNKLYLVSPNVLSPTSVGRGYPCHCEIKGNNLVVELLELNLAQRNGFRGNLTLTTGNTLWKSENNKPIAFNEVVIEDAKNLNVIFKSNSLYGQIVFIEIKGIEKIVCNAGSRIPVNLTETNSIAPRSPKQETVKGSSNTTISKVVTTVFAVIILVLIVLAIILLIYIIYRLRETRPSHRSIQTLENIGRSHIQFDCNSNTSDMPGTTCGQRSSRGTRSKLEQTVPHDRREGLIQMPRIRKDDLLVLDDHHYIDLRDVCEQDTDTDQFHKQHFQHSQDKFLLQRD